VGPDLIFLVYRLGQKNGGHSTFPEYLENLQKMIFFTLQSQCILNMSIVCEVTGFTKWRHLVNGLLRRLDRVQDIEDNTVV